MIKETSIQIINICPATKILWKLFLKERMREFMFEGKRWYDLRLLGADYVTKRTSAVATRLLWPINESVLTDNPALKQTPGYQN